MTFTPANGAVKIEADISGEQIGDLIVILPQKIVSNTNVHTENAALELSETLCQSADKIVQALLDISRVAD